MKALQKITSIILLVLLITSCAREIKPDLARLYHSQSHSHSQQPITRPPVILVHGIMGSKLRDKQSLKELWFGSLKISSFQIMKI